MIVSIVLGADGKKQKEKKKRSSVWCLFLIPCEKKQGHALFNFRGSAEIIQVPL